MVDTKYSCNNCLFSCISKGISICGDNFDVFGKCNNYSHWQPIEKQENKKACSERSTIQNIEKLLNSLFRLLQYKNKKYGDSALNPINIFSKLSPEEGIKIRLDDKIKRIISSNELRKNDVCDLMGYLVLLCASKDWLDFEEFKD